MSRIEAAADDITGKFSIGGIMPGAYQYQWLDDDVNSAADDIGIGYA